MKKGEEIGKRRGGVKMEEEEEGNKQTHGRWSLSEVRWARLIRLCLACGTRRLVVGFLRFFFSVNKKLARVFFGFPSGILRSSGKVRFRR